ncbi:hypothetical protein DPMN_086158 [Dreissena polymorpha]|uniref:Uncharacterized protein n=1 Tax=Dreissena polymorpha TaxID=45954 RepID=A0A9D3YDX3_DREPO|nr:hypothetical protein DPMN_086158 [Dreissena polymorpha]
MTMKELLDKKLIETASKPRQEKPKPNENKTNETKKKPTLGGKPITEDKVFNQLLEYDIERTGVNKKGKKPKTDRVKK